MVASLVGFGSAAPAGGHSLPVVPDGVTIGGVDVGGLIEVTRAASGSESATATPIRLATASTRLARVTGPVRRERRASRTR